MNGGKILYCHVKTQEVTLGLVVPRKQRLMEITHCQHASSAYHTHPQHVME